MNTALYIIPTEINPKRIVIPNAKPKTVIF